VSLWTKALELATSFGTAYDAGRAHLEIGRHLDAGRQIQGADRDGHFAASGRLLRSVGAALELRRLGEVEPDAGAPVELSL
jgi:hypothetical protein